MANFTIFMGSWERVPASFHTIKRAAGYVGRISEKAYSGDPHQNLFLGCAIDKNSHAWKYYKEALVMENLPRPL